MMKSNNRRNRRNESIPYFSLEIILEILCKLPIDSIMRCRCVCKAWYYLTKSPDFIEQLLSSNDHKQPGLILEPLRAHGRSRQPLFWVDLEIRRVRQIHIDPLKGLQAMGTCRGLLCVGSQSALDPLFVCNPITREYRRLPTSGETFIDCHEVGIGFDPSTGQYKILRTYVTGEQRRCFEVTTLGASSWRRLDVADGWQASVVYDPVFWNGAIHWKTCKDGCNYIISFDVCREKFRVITFLEEVPDLGIGSRADAEDVGQVEDVGQADLDHDDSGQLLPPPEGFVPDGYANLDGEPQELELLGFRGSLTIVEHRNEWMRLWEVLGDKVEDLSVCFWDEHDTHVLWNRYMTYVVIGRLSSECYLFQVSACYGKASNRKMHFTYFFPNEANYVPLDIPGLPPMFTTVRGYEPSLVSPGTA